MTNALAENMYGNPTLKGNPTAKKSFHIPCFRGGKIGHIVIFCPFEEIIASTKLELNSTFITIPNVLSLILIIEM